MLPELWQRARSVLAVRLDNLGDVIMLGPALRAVRLALPRAHITLMASPAGAAAVPMLPWVDDVLVARVLWQDVSGALPFDPSREQALVAEIGRRQFDLAVIFTSFAQSPYPPAYACYLAGIPIRLGQSREFGGGVLSPWVEPLSDESHQVDRNLHLLEATGLPVTRRDLELAVPAQSQERADRLLVSAGIGSGDPFIVVAPGASAAARRYPPQRFAGVVSALAERSGLPVVIVGSQREVGTLAPVTAAADGGRGVRSLVGKTSVEELAGVIRRSRLLVANNSGPMHMADALGTPMVVLFSGTELESEFRPRTARTHLLRRPTFCSPCRAFQCPYDLECLDYEPEDVVAAAMALLSEDQTWCG